MDKLTQLRNQYLELTNQVLPTLAQERKFPVRFNHCFQRIVLDNLFGRCWYEVLDRKQPAYKQLNEEQLEQAVAIAQAIMTQPSDHIKRLNQNSLRWRGKVEII
jgi:hypothetical protein